MISKQVELESNTYVYIEKETEREKTGFMDTKKSCNVIEIKIEILIGKS